MKHLNFRRAAAVLVVGAMAMSLSALASATPAKKGPYVDTIQFSALGVDQAVPSLKNGNIDVYAFGIKNTAAKSVQYSKDVKVYRAPSGSVSLILNPAPARSGELNPFSLVEVRRAVNYLINRDFVAQSIYGGNAIPQTSLVSKVDYDYMTVADVVAKEDIRYDIDYARRTIAKAMTKAGAKLVGGKWTYNGRTIRLKFIIRVEDERRDVGDAIATNLEKVGFTVDRSYQQFAGATYKVYTSDPASFEWHLYTEGWGRGSADRYDFANLNGMAAPWMANMPGWGIYGYWQYQDAALDRIGKQIFTGKFKSQQERNALYRDALKMSMDDAVRLWVVTTYSAIPARSALTNVTEDVVAGPKSFLTLRGAYIPGKNTLRVGNLWVWTERSTWNTVGGFEDVYSGDIWKNLVDSPIMNDPFKGTPIPFRSNFDVTTSGPKGTMPVPATAVVWNASADRWQNVTKGTTATSKVVFDFSKYFQSKWHDGSQITMADVLYGIASTFERTYDAKKRQIEFVLAATQKPLLDVFKGFRVLDKNKIEVYLDYWHFDKSYIASYANVVSLAMPWEVMAASDTLVFDRRMAAYSKSSAAKYSVPWLSLTTRSDATLVANVLRTSLSSRSVPKGYFVIGGKSYVTPKEAVAGYNAALKWFATYRHLVISNGPFLLKRYDPAAQYAEIVAFRDPSYPFTSDFWYRAKPKDIQFQQVSPRKDGVSVKLAGPVGTFSLRYLVVDERTGKVEATGTAVKGNGPGQFEVTLDSAVVKRLKGKFLKVTLLASSTATALVAEKSVPISL